MLTPEQAVLAAVLTCIAGAPLTLVVSRYKTAAGWVNFCITTASAALIFIAVFRVIAIGPSTAPALLWIMPKFGFALRFYVDGLTAIFLLLAGVIAAAAALYSITYMRHYGDYGVARYYPHFLLFLGAMYGLLSATDMMWFFFIFWQLMTLPSYALIRFEYKKKENVRAANKYLLMMELSCVAIMIGVALLSGGGIAREANLRYDFDTISANLPLLLSTRPTLVAIAFLLFLVGFGIKAGMWPFGQLWLPDAHPAAPSPVSAMLSGVMIKTGVYGLIRCFLWLVPAPAYGAFPITRWGFLIALLGTMTLFTGTMQALKQEQCKRLLAFSSIGQVGYVLLAVGACMAMLNASRPAVLPLAAVALAGALFHVLNHGVFKSLLFLNAGSVLHATGTQDLDKLGGLMKFMPITAVTAMVASFAISGVPLFNGFVSKWVIYVAAVQGARSAHYLGIFAAIAILTSAITLACFLKLFGLAFLSRSSALVRERAAQARLEVPLTMQIPQVFLAASCVVLGILPVLGLRFVERALVSGSQPFGALTGNAEALGATLTGIATTLHAVYAPVALLTVILLAFALAQRISRMAQAARRAAAPWLCGYAVEAECHRYLARNFYGEIKRHFSWLGGLPQPSKR